MLCCSIRHTSLLHLLGVALQADTATVTSSLQQATGSTHTQLAASSTSRQRTFGAGQSLSASGAADCSQIVTPRTTARSLRKAHVEELSKRVHAKPVALRQQIRLQAQQQVNPSCRIQPLLVAMAACHLPHDCELLLCIVQVRASEVWMARLATNALV